MEFTTGGIRIIRGKADFPNSVQDFPFLPTLPNLKSLESRGLYVVGQPNCKLFSGPDWRPFRQNYEPVDHFYYFGCQLKVQTKILFVITIFPLHTIFPLSCHTFHTSFTIDSALFVTLPTPRPFSREQNKSKKI